LRAPDPRPQAGCLLFLLPCLQRRFEPRIAAQRVPHGIEAELVLPREIAASFRRVFERRDGFRLHVLQCINFCERKIRDIVPGVFPLLEFAQEQICRGALTQSGLQFRLPHEQAHGIWLRGEQPFNRLEGRPPLGAGGVSVANRPLGQTGKVGLGASVAHKRVNLWELACDSQCVQTPWDIAGEKPHDGRHGRTVFAGQIGCRNLGEMRFGASNVAVK